MLLILINMNFVDVGQSVLTTRIRPSSNSTSIIANASGPRPSMQSYSGKLEELKGHNTALSSRGQRVDANMISMAVNHAKHGRLGGINNYFKLQYKINGNFRQSCRSNATTIGYSSAACNGWS